MCKVYPVFFVVMFKLTAHILVHITYNVTVESFHHLLLGSLDIAL
jgi:hypothetical protein